MVVIVKPTYACNFKCKYCYLTEETKTPSCLNIDLAKKIIIQIKDAVSVNSNQKLTIIWHGGEPLLWGINNYKTIFDFMEKEFEGFEYKNSIQTNLSLMNDEFIDLFLKHNVHVGFSLDGTKDVHDSQRVDFKDEGTFDTIMKKVALCKAKGLSIGCIVVATKKHIDKISELYSFMCNSNINFKFNPLFSAGEAAKNTSEFSLSPGEYAKMSIELFDLWFFDKENQNKNSTFIEIASNLITRRPSGCVFGKNCQNNFMAISPDGDIFPCGRFCDYDFEKYSYGNLSKEKLINILPKIKTSAFYKRYEYIKNSSCGQCQFFDICHGGCIHDGFVNSNDLKSKTFLCSAYKKIFTHIQERLQEVNMM
jgi:uncharacterized protein